MTAAINTWPMPPSELMFMGEDHAGMIRNGLALLEVVQSSDGFSKDKAVLDIGCGYGRMAYSLFHSGHKAAYFGMDILPKHINWLKTNLMPVLPAGSDFIHLDIQNGRYNPSGKISADKVKFPHLQHKPSVILAFSVFTHMYPNQAEHYIKQFAKILPVGGMVCASFFLLTPDSSALEEAGASQYPMKHRHSATCRFFNQDDPLHAIAFDEAWVRNVIQSAGLTIECIEYGNWCGRTGAKMFQDIIIMRKQKRFRWF